MKIETRPKKFLDDETYTVVGGDKSMSLPSSKPYICNTCGGEAYLSPSLYERFGDAPADNIKITCFTCYLKVSKDTDIFCIPSERDVKKDIGLPVEDLQ